MGGRQRGVRAGGVVGQGRMTSIGLSYIDKLQRENADDLAFYPLTTLNKALEDGHVITCEDNGEAAGYLWFGAVRGGYDITIYQACVDYSSRRRHLGWGMVAKLVEIGRKMAATGIRLKCASSADSNEFWQGRGVLLHSRDAWRNQAWAGLESLPHRPSARIVPAVDGYAVRATDRPRSRTTQ
jgi:hypothetical protein